MRRFTCARDEAILIQLASLQVTPHQGAAAAEAGAAEGAQCQLRTLKRAAWAHCTNPPLTGARAIMMIKIISFYQRVKRGVRLKLAGWLLSCGKAQKRGRERARKRRRRRRKRKKEKESEKREEERKVSQSRDQMIHVRLASAAFRMRGSIALLSLGQV